jgi:putative membrane protein insertion efficiency factor
VRLYRARLSPLFALSGVRCRFEPSCSRYAEGAIAKSGGLVGPLRAFWRVARCGPWTAAGTVDPP